MFENGFEIFLVKYQVYFLRLITPLVSKLVAALLNISKETGSTVFSVGVCFTLWVL